MSLSFGSPAESMATKSTSSGFDIASALQKLLGPDPLVLELPSTIEGVTKTLLNLRKSPVQLLAARLKAVPPRPVSEMEWKQLAAFLAAMYNLEMIDPRMKNEAKLDIGLQVIFDPKFKFPPEYARVAKFIYEKLEAERWGADEVEAEDAAEEEDDFKVRNGITAGSSSSTVRKSSGPLKDSDYPHDTDPIYGVHGIMHHILRIKGPQTTAYQIDPKWITRDSKVFGHNGFQVGECWPTQMALLRDGAHGQRMGGISGSATAGTYSIVISGGLYDDLDNDKGDTVYYSGSNSHESTSAEPVTSNKTKALERSLSTRKPIRVFRSSRGKWVGAPRAGLRYDGLYTVMNMTIGKNRKGGAYKTFRLERENNQGPIRTQEPSQQLISLFERVTDGYTRTRPGKMALG